MTMETQKLSSNVLTPSHFRQGLGPGRVLGDLLHGRGQWSTSEPRHHSGVSVGAATAMMAMMAMGKTPTSFW